MRTNRTAPDAGLHEHELIGVLVVEHQNDLKVVETLSRELDRTKRLLRYTRLERTICLLGIAGMAVGAAFTGGWM